MWSMKVFPFLIEIPSPRISATPESPDISRTNNLKCVPRQIKSSFKKLYFSLSIQLSHYITPLILSAYYLFFLCMQLSMQLIISQSL